MAGILILIAIGASLLGLLLLTQATYGVGLLAFACVTGILARIAQAQELHRATTPAPIATAAPQPARAQRSDRTLYILATVLVGLTVLVIVVMYALGSSSLLRLE